MVVGLLSSRDVSNLSMMSASTKTKARRELAIERQDLHRKDTSTSPAYRTKSSVQIRQMSQ